MKKQTHTHEFNVLRLSGLREDQVYTIGDLGCLAAHVFFLVSFSVLGIVPMAAYNVFSVGFYAVMPFVIRKTKNRTPLMFLVMPEIMLHTLLAVIILGWTPGFSMYLIYIMAIPFLMPLKRVWVPYLFSGLCVVEFIALRIFCGSGYSPVYALSDSMTLVYYLVNTFSGAVIIIYIASIYMFYREIMQRRLISKNESLQQHASVDPLTQLFNRRSMTDFLKRIKESGKPYTIGLGTSTTSRRSTTASVTTPATRRLKPHQESCGGSSLPRATSPAGEARNFFSSFLTAGWKGAGSTPRRYVRLSPAR